MAAEITRNVARCAQVLRTGGLVAFATETVYGLGADALDPNAVAKIFAAKRRPEFDPLIVHVAEIGDIEPLAKTSHPLFETLSQQFWPGPLTLLLPKLDIIPDLVTSGLPDVGIRIPANDVARQLIKVAGVPVAAPSANLFGRTSPTTAAHVVEQLGESVDLVLDDGPCSVGVESTVVRMTGPNSLKVLRVGGTTLEMLRTVCGNVTVVSNLLDETAPAAPGQLASHYAPLTPIQVVGDWNTTDLPPRAAALCFQQAPPDHENLSIVEILSPDGSLVEATANFFAALRRLDCPDIDVILAERFPDRELGVALNDRLRRAATR
ncbi:MAG: threonylcarbamoyl-AMP synthase [Planctomycetaceae bacterium]|nr:threonylcarbamoyl-AMP synthase [Planctomycetaceae bacterium]